ncbi:hypothetical protein Baya_16688 [Bagarius yarrelli]|uniref:Uncharacterized protein n=1 Tax=Bagarius yarrelli TaxID=175774 RepID=A0A556VXQ3_BAGYA|nr:hypothetical protein Baya_16688 [Bagarius yarrelli]
MGAILAIVVEVAVAEIAAIAEAATAEAVATIAGAGLESAVEIGEAATAVVETATEAAAETAAEGATEAAGETAAEITSSTAAEITARVLKYIPQLFKLIKEACAIDAIFRVAEGILKEFLKYPEKYDKLKRAVDVLEKFNNKLNEIMKWLEDHKNDYVTLEGFDVSLESGILAKFLKQLFMALGNMKRLADDIDKINQNKQPIKDAQITTINRSMIRMTSALEALARFKEKKQSKIPALASLPVSIEEVEFWKLELGASPDTYSDDALNLLHLDIHKY